MINVEDLLKYLKEKIPNFTKTSKRGQILITCPQQSEHKFQSISPTMTTIPGSSKWYCLVCGFKGDTYDLIRLVEKKPNLTNDEIVSFMTDTMKMDVCPELDAYQKYGWSLFAIAKNSKKPLKDEHWREEGVSTKEKSKWLNWLESGCNLAVNCEFSNVMIIDFDDKEIKEESIPLRDELKKLLEDNKTLTQNTPRGGKHFVFIFDSKLWVKQKVNVAGLAIDTRTEKGYFLVSPSKYEGNSYNWINLGVEIKIISSELKSKLLELIEVDKGRKTESTSELSQKTKDAIEHPIELVNNNLEGCCNDTFVRFGGVLVKMGLPVDIVKGILFYLNKNWLRNPMPTNVIEAMLGSLEGYKGTEEQTQEQSIYDACQIIQNDIGAKDIIDHVFPGDNKKRATVDKYLAKLHKEGKLSRVGRGKYNCKQQVDWTDEPQIINPLSLIKMPYFNEVAKFYEGNIILIGGAYGEGKTTLAVNFIKQLKEQGVKPYYIPLESGSSFEEDIKAMGLTCNDYYTPKVDDDHPPVNPMQIEIQSHSFTIIDWLDQAEDFAKTQSILKHFNEEMRRSGGILVIFVQIRKTTHEWFAPDLINTYPAFAARFIWDDNDIGLVSHFSCDKIRNPIGHYSTAIKETYFNFETKEIKLKNNL